LRWSPSTALAESNYDDVVKELRGAPRKVGGGVIAQMAEFMNARFTR
jgi:hypothetical protein